MDEKLFEKLLDIKEQEIVFILGKELLGVNNYFVSEKTKEILNEIETKDRIL